MDLDYGINDWRVRLKVVQDHLNEVNGDVNNREIERLGTYVLYQYEKELKLDSTRKNTAINKQQQKALEDKEKNKGASVVYNKPLSREDKINKSINNIHYYKLIDYLDEKAQEFNVKYNGTLDVHTRNEWIKQCFKRDGIKSSSSSVYAELNADIKCSLSEYERPVNISEGMTSRHYKLDDVDVDYTNKEVVKVILKNFKSINQEANKMPYSTMFCIREDFIKAINNIKFTKAQARVLNEILDGELVTPLNQKTFYRIVDKFVIYFS